MLQVSAVGSPDTATAQMDEFVQRTGADELITITYAFDPEVQRQSLRLLADAWF